MAEYTKRKIVLETELKKSVQPVVESCMASLEDLGLRVILFELAKTRLFNGIPS